MLTFAPDADDTAPEVLHLVSGIPTVRGYAPPPTGTDVGSTALPAASNGGATVFDVNGGRRTFAATTGNIYEYGSATWTSRIASTFNRVRFAGFGNFVFAANQTSQLLKTSGSTFTTVEGPTAGAIAVFGDFLMLGNTNDTGISGLSTGFGSQVNRWWCSQIFDGTANWTPAISTQCASGLLVKSDGKITGLVPLLNGGVVYKQNSMYLARYVGPPEVWEFELVENQIGCAVQEGVQVVGSTHYFIGPDDIFAFDGTRARSIGSGVREWFFSTMNKESVTTMQSKHDPLNKHIYWFYAGTGQTALNKVLVYHYPTGRFGAFDFTIREAMPVVGGSEVLIATVDDTARELTMLYLDSSSDAFALIGAGTTLTLTTSWTGNEDKVTLCDRVKPRFGDGLAASAATCTPSGCMYIGEAPVVGSASTMSSGRFDVLQAAKYHRFSESYTGASELQSRAARMSEESEE